MNTLIIMIHINHLTNCFIITTGVSTGVLATKTKVGKEAGIEPCIQTSHRSGFQSSAEETSHPGNTVWQGSVIQITQG